MRPVSTTVELFASRGRADRKAVRFRLPLARKRLIIRSSLSRSAVAGLSNYPSDQPQYQPQYHPQYQLNTQERERERERERCRRPSPSWRPPSHHYRCPSTSRRPSNSPSPVSVLAHHPLRRALRTSVRRSVTAASRMVTMTTDLTTRRPRSKQRLSQQRHCRRLLLLQPLSHRARNRPNLDVGTPSLPLYVPSLMAGVTDSGIFVH